MYRMLEVDCDQLQQYLKWLDLRKYRGGLARLRCSSHKLRIETGRHTGEPLADRVCKLCLKNRNVYVLEDEYHHVMTCPSFIELRETYLTEWITDASYETFLNLLNATEEITVKNLASFIYHANSSRTRMLE